jgi:hypothetical protein
MNIYYPCHQILRQYTCDSVYSAQPCRELANSHDLLSSPSIHGKCALSCARIITPTLVTTSTFSKKLWISWMTRSWHSVILSKTQRSVTRLVRPCEKSRFSMVIGLPRKTLGLPDLRTWLCRASPCGLWWRVSKSKAIPVTGREGP